VRLDNAEAVVGAHMWAAKQGLAALSIQWNEGQYPRLSTADIVRQLEVASQTPGVVARKTDLAVWIGVAFCETIRSPEGVESRSLDTANKKQ
jgi:hypothetical protein